MRSWLDERAGLGPITEKLAHKTVPVHRYTVLYYFGGMTLFFFTVQVVTGILLMLYYRPSANEAFESVEFIMTTVPFGWLIRSVHSWSANLMVYFAFVHLFSVFFLKAYRRPREMTWITGCILVFLVLGFGFSGYLLPWNMLSFFATKVGTDIAGVVPVVGEWMLRFLRGGDQVTGATLSRFYGWHVAILPAIVVSLLGIHLLLVQVHGMSVPPGREGEAKSRRPMRFFPNFALREVFGWTLALGVLASLAALFPWELGQKADAFAPAFKNIRPEWYFMFMFETLKLVPGGEIFGIEYEAIPILLFGLVGLLLVLVPFLDRDPARRGRSRLLSIIGWISLLYMVGMTAWGYRSWVPVCVVLATALVIAILALGTRRVRRRGSSAAARMAVMLALIGLPFTSSGLRADSEPPKADTPAQSAADSSAADSSAAGSSAADSSAADRTTSCLACHGDADMFEAQDLAIVQGFADDVHRTVGLSCHDCHGGDPDPAVADDLDRAMDEGFATNPYRGAPGREQIPGFCGRCHSDADYMHHFKADARVDQEREYRTSRHGQALAAGDTAVATCIDCHSVHGIRQVDDPQAPVYPTRVAETCSRCHSDTQRMAGRKTQRGEPMPTNQYRRWRASVHAATMVDRGDLSAPTCNDCHGNHGASPPGLASAAFVCGQCHGREAEDFNASAKSRLLAEHQENLEEAGEEGCAACHEPPEPAAERTQIHHLSGCTTCHGTHAVIRPTVATLAPLPDIPCAMCHEGPGGLDERMPEQAQIKVHYSEVRDRLVAEAAAQGKTGSALFDHLVDQARTLPQHALETESGRVLRPEFARLFEKFRIGKTTATAETDGEPVAVTVRRCSDCHSAGSKDQEPSTGFATAHALLDGMRALTVATARAERTALRAQHGGVETRAALDDIEQAVDAQIQLEVLLHTFSAEKDSPFAKKQAEGMEHAQAALEAGNDALVQLAKRRRGLYLSLIASAFLMVAVALKIRELSARAGD